MRYGLIALIAVFFMAQLAYFAWFYQGELGQAREILTRNGASENGVETVAVLAVPGGPIVASDDPGLGQELLVGQVLDGEGRGVQAVEVLVDQRDLVPEQIVASQHRRPRWRTAPNGEGEFRLESLEPGAYVVMARNGTHHAATTIQIAAQGLVQPLTLILEPSRTFRGRVLDGAGEPVARALVFPLPDAAYEPDADPARFPYAWHPARTDISGYFFFPHLPPAAPRLLVTHGDYAHVISEAIPENGGDFEVILGDGASALIQLEEEGKPVPRSKLRLLEQAFRIESIASHTNPAGRAEFRQLRPGRYDVILESDRFALKEGLAEIEIPEAGQATITLEAVRGGTIRGRVVEDDTGIGVAGVQVALRTEIASPPLQVQTDRGGYYRFAGLTPGLYRVEVQPSETYLVVETPDEELEVQSNDRSHGPEFRLKSGVLVQGTVKTDDGAPVANANVYLSLSGDQTVHRAVRSNYQGAFSFEGISAEAQVRIWATDGAQASHAFGPTQAGEAGLPHIQLVLDHTSAASIRGEVINAQGAAMANALLVLHLPGESLPEPRRTQADAWGTYRFENLPPGAYRLEVLVSEENPEVVATEYIKLADGATEIVNVALSE